MWIDAGFEGGNIVVDGVEGDRVRLSLRPDAGGVHRQWFHFRVLGAAGRRLEVSLHGLRGTSFPEGWAACRPVVSADLQAWRRVDAVCAGDGDTLSFVLEPAGDLLAVAYFAPYDSADLARLLAFATAHGASVRSLGRTPDGRALPVIAVGPADGRPVVWVTARQHPGETMASHWVEGFVRRWLDRADPLARVAAGQVALRVVPLANPDGAARGHIRTNALGTDLNRAWAAADAAAAPEVAAIRAAMDETGVSLAIDVHGDEVLPWVFFAPAEALPGRRAPRLGLQASFTAACVAHGPSVQTVNGYRLYDGDGTPNPSMGSNALAARYGCAALTLEMPFQDDAQDPCPREGWSPARCARLGAAMVGAVAAVVGELDAPGQAEGR